MKEIMASPSPTDTSIPPISAGMVGLSVLAKKKNAAIKKFPTSAPLGLRVLVQPERGRHPI